MLRISIDSKIYGDVQLHKIKFILYTENIRLNLKRLLVTRIRSKKMKGFNHVHATGLCLYILKTSKNLYAKAMLRTY